MQSFKEGEAVLAEAASPISSRPPAQEGFNELGRLPRTLGDEGEEAERGPGPGNRWPREQTLALLKIRSEMDPIFRDASLKGPLWEVVSRKLAELGYTRSAKKCKEKFENVQKYYKRTKETRASRPEGKNYKFFSQLEALHSSNNTIIDAAASAAPQITGAITASSSAALAGVHPPPALASPAPANNAQPPGAASTAQLPVPGAPDLAASRLAAEIIFSSDSSLSSSDSDVDMEEGPSAVADKRRRPHSSWGTRKFMAFFDGLIRQVMEKQEGMQRMFLETIEKQEQDRMAREEAWRRQETARIAREHEIIAQERAASASRDAVVLAFLQKITGKMVQVPQLVAISGVPLPAQPPQLPKVSTAAPPPPPQPKPESPSVLTLQKEHEHKSPDITATVNPHLLHPSTSSEVSVIAPPAPLGQEAGGSFNSAFSSPSRWPKSEVLSLIKLRTELEARYQESGPKGPLWEEISRRMQQLGFHRNPKRCKEKWENINKYYKKVKESNKKRPEDSKTCPYFSQLDTLYQKKILGGGSGSGGGVFTTQFPPHQDMNLNSNPYPNTMPQNEINDLRPQAITSHNNGEGPATGSYPIQSSINGSPSPIFFKDVQFIVKKPEGITKEPVEQQQAAIEQHGGMEEEMIDGDEISQEDDEDTVDEEDGMI